MMRRLIKYKFMDMRYLQCSIPWVLALTAAVLFLNVVHFPKMPEAGKSVLNDPLYTGSNTCGDFPCFGDSLCKAFIVGQVEPRKETRIRRSKSWITFQAVLLGKYKTSRSKNCTVHALEGEFNQGNGEFPEVNKSVDSFRRYLCQSFGFGKDCDPITSLREWKLFQRVLPVKGILKAELVRDLSTPLKCASQRFLNRIVRRSGSPGNGYMTLQGLTTSDKSSLLFKLKMAPRMWMSEVFPSNEGWPFGYIYGACGRMIVHKDLGEVAFADAYKEPWKKRVDVAVQMLEVAFQLTDNSDKFWFLLNRIKPEDFILNEAGRLKITNVDEIVVVDISNDASEKTKEMNGPCRNANKHSNVNTICNIINGNDVEESLLHHPEGSETFVKKLQNLLKECSSNANNGESQAEAALEAKKMLSHIRPCSEIVPYRFPECHYLS